MHQRGMSRKFPVNVNIMSLILHATMMIVLIQSKGNMQVRLKVPIGLPRTGDMMVVELVVLAITLVRILASSNSHVASLMK